MRKPRKCSFAVSQFKGLQAKGRLDEGLETATQRRWKKWCVLWLSLMFFAESPSVLAQAKTPAKPARNSATTKSETVAVFNTTGLAQKVFQIKHANVDK